VKQHILVVAFAICTPPLALAETDASARDPAASTAVLVSVTETEPQASYPLEQLFVGRVEARRSAELGFERAGRLIEVKVREGDQVVAGALLARLDPSLLQARRTELLADLASAEADLALAEVTANRYRDSVKDGAVTRQDLDEASEGASAARARLQLAEARIASIDLDLSKTELRAPFAGTLIRRTADEGTVLSAAQPLVTLQETATPEIRIGVAGPLLDALHPGRGYQLQIGGVTIPAQLRAVIPLRTGVSRTVDALFDPLVDPVVDPPADPPTELTEQPTVTSTPYPALNWAKDQASDDVHLTDPTGHQAAQPAGEAAGQSVHAAVLRPGNLAELRLSKEVAAEGFWLPLTALSEGMRGLWQALVVEPEPDTAADDEVGQVEASAQASSRRGRLVSRSIQVLHTDRERVFVRGALQPGDLVVTAGLHRLVPGQWVQIAQIGEDDADQAR
jgi:multidrug efflux pump subunit AcrA (membrane-fusion protein)